MLTNSSTNPAQHDANIAQVKPHDYTAMPLFTKVLAIGAHPDDIEYGCLGFLLKLGDAVEKHAYVACLGSIGDPSTSLSRKQESANSLAVLAPASLAVREKAGIESHDFAEVMGDLYKIIESSHPDLILTMSAHDSHQEHRAIYDITVSAARRSKASIMCYGILSNTLDFKPSFFVDIESVFAKKKEALRKHVSQAGKYYMSDEYLDIFHGHNYAALHGVRYCEAYEVVRLFA